MTRQKIPATVITGFLGAGKTTLVRHLLETAHGRRIALIVNEFGDEGVDGDVLKACGNEACGPEDIVELANGCICCTVADDFIPTMSALIERAEPPEHIVIETSGLALPQPLVKAFNWPEIKSQVTVDGVITVVDAPALAAGRFAHDHGAIEQQRLEDPELDHESPLEELFEDQMNCADLVLLNKTDLVASDQLDHLKHDLADKLRPGARLITASHGRIDSAVLFGLEASAEDDLSTRQSHHERHGEEDHDHDDFESFTVTFDQPLDKTLLLERLETAIRAEDILRLKGFVAIKDAAARLQIQAVGPRIDQYFDRPWQAGEEPHSALVVIGLKGLDKERITATLQG